ncbi:MAG: 50S ribosomal protein L6 [Deltaproteobacteria bacterium]|jgi:large subunit ribosomal protein L6|nr:50S ribosomal protein L6 [Deltaproteobacteria bacterium]
MSRIGKLPISIPKAVEVEWQAPVLKVTGGQTTLTRDIHQDIDLTVSDGQIEVKPKFQGPKSSALWGLTRTLVNNMVQGVSAGFTKVLEVVGVGWRVELLDPQTLKLNLGFSHPVEFKVPQGVAAQCDSKTNKITLKSADKELLGLTAARIRAYRKPEPYKGKGIRYEGEVIARKVGKAGGK